MRSAIVNHVAARTPTPIRLGWFDPATLEWRPAFCGVPERWTSLEVADDADTYVEIELAEPLSLAAFYDFSFAPQLTLPVAVEAANDYVLPLVFDEHPFPYVDLADVTASDAVVEGNADGTPGTVVAGTALDCARILTNVTRPTWITADRQGRIVRVRGYDVEYTDADPNPAPAVTIAADDLPTGALRVRHDPDAVVNSVTQSLAYPNATTTTSFTARDDDSIAKFGRRHLDVVDEWSATLTASSPLRIVRLRANADKQVDALDVGPGDNHFDTCTDLDIRSPITIDHAPRTSPVTVNLEGFVRTYTTRVQITADRTYVRASLTPDIYETATEEV